MLDADLLPLRSDRAALRAMRTDDAAAYAAGSDDPAVRRHAHLPEPEYTEESVIALVRGEAREGLERGDLALLTVADPDTDEFAGSLVLFGADAGSVEVGFWVHPGHRGNGLAAAALALAVEFARRSGFATLTARTAPDNPASQRALDRTGFVRGDTSRGIAPSGQDTVLVHYRLDLDPITLFPLPTERLRLRLVRHADAPALQRIYGRAEVARYLLDEPWTDSDAGHRVAERMARTGLDGGRTALALAIEHEGAVVGDAQLWLTDAQRRVAETGWVLDSAHGGRGSRPRRCGPCSDWRSSGTGCTASPRRWTRATRRPRGSRSAPGCSAKRTCARTGGARASGRTR